MLKVLGKWFSRLRIHLPPPSKKPLLSTRAREVSLLHETVKFGIISKQKTKSTCDDNMDGLLLWKITESIIKIYKLGNGIPAIVRDFGS